MCPNSICKAFRIACPGGWAQSCLEPESLLPDVSPKVDRLPDPASNLFPDDSLKEDEQRSHSDSRCGPKGTGVNCNIFPSTCNALSKPGYPCSSNSTPYCPQRAESAEIKVPWLRHSRLSSIFHHQPQQELRSSPWSRFLALGTLCG